ncbi:MAG: prepilin-type N-terminal cleavage/methylation domain-containing protein [Pirellula sp.]|jgi:prepilin-type N-terminal cleavage/methylation domain-containing protein|nr:prepilin-type N-terminal cleavage/methylation domain-containing protein [Pirellula sp.]
MYRAIRQVNRGSRGGVSLLELTVTVLILGIVAAIASPTYSSSLQKYRTEVTSQRIVQDIEQTRRVARQTNSSRTITFSTTSQSYTIALVGSLDRVGQSYEIPLDRAPYHSRLLFLATSAQPSVSQSTVAIVFDRFGMPNQGVRLRVGSGAIEKWIDVAPVSGRVSVQ